MGLGDLIDKVAFAAIIGVFLFGVWENSGQLGGLDTVVTNVINDPLNYGIAGLAFSVGFDIWVPAYPSEILGPFSFFGDFFYWYSGGYVPSFSNWVFIFALVAAGVSAFIVKWRLRWSLFGKAGLTALGVGLLHYYIGQCIGWWMLGWGAEKLGLDGYGAWESAVNATLNPVLFWFLLALIPLSLYSVGKSVGRRVF